MKFALASLVAAFALTATLAGAQTAPSPAPTQPPPAAVTVHIKNFAYVPASVTVKPGDTVRFVNDDDPAHTVTASDGSFDSGYLAKGDGWSHTFANGGTYAYYCAYHTYMKATVVVAP